jgi:hypothetical protein
MWKYGQNVGRTIFLFFYEATRPAVPSWYRPSPDRNYCPSYACRPAGRKPPFNRLVRGFLALLAFCYSFWAAAVSGAAVAANPRHRAKARREGARAHSYTSRGATAVPWAGRSGHTMAIRGAHEVKNQALKNLFVFLKFNRT